MSWSTVSNTPFSEGAASDNGPFGGGKSPVLMQPEGLYERHGQTPSITKQLPPMPLPVAADDWRQHFEVHLFRDRTVEDAFDEARVCRLEFKAEELGESTVECEREFVPLRWSVRRQGGAYMVRLHDDSGTSGEPRVTRIAFETPTVEEELDTAHEYSSPTGGMYIARQGQIRTATVVPPEVRTLDDLRCTPRIDREARSQEAIVRSLRIAQLWGRARLTGPFSSAQRKRDVLLALERHITRLICGDRWADAELSSQEAPDGMAGLKEAVSQQAYERGIGSLVAEECVDIAAKTSGERVERMASLATKFHLVPSAQGESEWDPHRLSELALRIASDPAEVMEWAGEGLRVGVAHLMELPTVARAARFLVLLIRRHSSVQGSPDRLYAGLDWR